MSLSIQLYTVRKSLEEDLPGTIKRLAEIGFTQVEPYRFVAKAAELRAALAENGLTAPSGHAPLLQEDQDEILAAARDLGIGTVIDPHVPAERWKDLESIKETARQLNEAAKKASEYGLRVGYHNHWWEIEDLIEGRTPLEHLADHLDPEVVLELDTYWAAVGGQDPVELLGRLGDRVKFIHIKDGPVTREPSDQLPLGQGSIPVFEVIGAATALEAAVVELDDFRGDMFDAVEQSFGFVSAGKVQA
ncbi:sugar phosphate isomerase/epimerase family protein [Sinomonas flava]|uniref:sugar phosphate isomerase/epimerase family protein n=1 Tax=Sinomonas flava TaxID=496857 RepID=UPI0039A4F3DF